MFRDRQALLGHKSESVTTDYSAAEIESLIAHANKVAAGDQRRRTARRRRARRGDLATELAEAQERPQRVGNTLHGWGCHALRLLSNERDRVARAKVMQADLCLPEAPDQELPGRPGVGVNGGRRQPGAAQNPRSPRKSSSSVNACRSWRRVSGRRERRRARLRWNRSMSSSVSTSTSMPRPSHHRPKANACLATMQA